MNTVKKIIFLILLSGISILTCGCVEKYGKADIEKYVNTKLGNNNFLVEDNPMVVKDESGYEDKYWTVKMLDDTKLEFYVIDNTDYAYEAVYNKLECTFDSELTEYLYNKYGAGEMLSLSTDENKTFLTGEYSNRKELDALFDDIQSFIEMNPYVNENFLVRVKLTLNNPVKDSFPESIDDGDINSSILEVTEEERNKAEEELLLTCLDYCFNDNINGFTKEEINKTAKANSCLLAKYNNDTQSYDIYDDIFANRFSYGVSFSSLYKVLSVEGFEPDGNILHYSFTGIDGCKYEISYDFSDYQFEDEKGYYYIKDGKKVPMDYYFYNHFKYDEIETMTGLELKNIK